MNVVILSNRVWQHFLEVIEKETVKEDNSMVTTVYDPFKGS